MNKLLKRIAFLGVFIFIVNFLAMKFHWYYVISWFDMPMHFIGGIFVCLLSLVVYISYFLKKDSTSSFRRFLFIGVISTFIIAVLWEVFEFSLDTFIIIKRQNIFDTISDLFFGLGGSFAATLYFGYNKAYGKYLKN